MPMNPRQQAVFATRTNDTYLENQQRAREVGAFLDYRLEDIRAYVINNLGERKCHYCRGPVKADTFALDEKVPAARGGSLAFHNLAVVCKHCRAAKGDLDYIEFKELLGLLRSWSPFVRRYLLARLRSGRAEPEQRALPRPREKLREWREEESGIRNQESGTT